jgi:cytochrome P450
MIDPTPPHAEGVGLPWDVPVDDAVAAIADARRRHGDTFTVRSGEDSYLFTFSPVGVTSFYALPEALASKGVADYLMLRRKLPDEVFAGRRTLPHELFTRDGVAGYLANLDDVLGVTAAELGPSGRVDAFALGRRIGHRVGLSSWGGPGADRGTRFDRLVAAFDVLDGSDAFVHPDAMAAVAASGKAAETAALEVVVSEVTAAIAELDPDGADHPLLRSIVGSWSGEAAEVAGRGAALDVALVHIASLSNLVAALGWYVVDLLERPDLVDRIRAGDTGLAERAALESVRLAQRSIMARHVLEPVPLDVGDAVYEVGRGVTVATLLPLTNTESPGYGTFRPDRWRGRRLADVSDLGARELVATFGHGSHTCPAQPFSLAAMARTAQSLVDGYDLEPRWDVRPGPVPAQIGGVARAAGPCEVGYVRRA